MNNPACELERIVTAVLCITDKVTTNAQTLNFIRYIKQGDDAIFSHCLNVALLCGLYGLWMNLSKEDISNLILSGVFHDIGKIHISSKILYKPGKLTDIEFKEIKKHTIYGYQLLNKPHIPKAVQMSALMHHEKWDGTGYPLGRSGMTIKYTTEAGNTYKCHVLESMQHIPKSLDSQGACHKRQPQLFNPRICRTFFDVETIRDVWKEYKSPYNLSRFERCDVMMIKTLTANNFKSIVLESSIPVIVDFYAEWCKPCLRLMPIIEEVTCEKSGHILVCKVNVDQVQEIANTYGVMNLPSILKFENGEISGRLVDAVSKHDLLALVG